MFNVGTRSVLFGAHQFLIHPWFVAWAWWRLYGFPWDPRLWVAFFVHDVGYVGKPNMDGQEGERHVELGARIMHVLFDGYADHQWGREWCCDYCGTPPSTDASGCTKRLTRWYEFCLYHSRFYAKRNDKPFSRLCVADKLATVLTPWWLYIPMATATGEIHEYMHAIARANAGEPNKYAGMNIYSSHKREWYGNMQEYLLRWVEERRQDTWTPDMKKARDASGVWQ